MNRRTQTRRIVSWILLLIFISTTTLQTLHHHDVVPQTQKVCLKCLHHLPHAGHLTYHLTAPCNCPLCQFWGSTYVVPAITHLSTPYSYHKNHFSGSYCRLFTANYRTSSPRAPPFHFA